MHFLRFQRYLYTYEPLILKHRNPIIGITGALMMMMMMMMKMMMMCFLMVRQRLTGGVRLSVTALLSRLLISVTIKCDSTA